MRGSITRGGQEAIPKEEEAKEGVSSFGKSLFLGEIHEELVFPAHARTR